MIKAILAVGANGELGCSSTESGLPWDKNPEDMKYFRDQTLGKVVVYGGNTFRQFQKMGMENGLPKRFNYVVTSQGRGQQDGGYVKVDFDTLKGCIISGDSVFNYKDTFIIGGKSVYNQLHPYCEEVHLTRIKKAFPDADVKINLDWLCDFDIISTTKLNEYSEVEVWRRR